ncbi:MAG TPA: OmpH family outer membrane protein [Ignavibacteriales bacterium]|nr:OmpH family outer membrane protein [Ignavibacteriales bacterium]HOL80221.1 OmpH family outer membrane protein [Ignavibacteriales bacterium]HOM64502.1 OmpH family outer membrane protein [Ignavibacteriales bacterium]HPD66599.1 OmpH family outer membrane protein [Ignavibacteriales bacterium]HPP32410.1 OmpH family outer membrane protein [Ignavibacteriales bacterium]
MKKVFFILIFFVLNTISFGQLKIGYIDSDAIIKSIPDAQQAQQELDKIVNEWKNELQRMQNDWKAKYDDYENRKLIMTNETRARVETELKRLEEKINEFRQKKFGPKGEYLQKQEELFKPIHNRIFNVIKEIADKENYDFIFDRSGDVMFIYAKDKYDLTQIVIEKLK